MTTFRSFFDTDHSAILDLATGLSDWFDDDARTRAIPIDLHHQQGFVAEAEGHIVGFITLFVAEGRLNIGWLGVSKEYQRKGVGGRLLKAAEQVGRELSLTELATYILGDSVDYEPYEQTRAFYFRHGFRIYQRSKTNNPSCPEEIKIAKKIAQPTSGTDGV